LLISSVRSRGEVKWRENGVRADDQASLHSHQASNKVIMKTVSKRLATDIEYLRALAEMYEQDKNQAAQEATGAAIAALRRLIEVVDHPAKDSSEKLPAAA
jgi:DNA helicase HerA-like ATPase